MTTAINIVNAAYQEAVQIVADLDALPDKVSQAYAAVDARDQFEKLATNILYAAQHAPLNSDTKDFQAKYDEIVKMDDYVVKKYLL
jgi:hypothetical protein